MTEQESDDDETEHHGPPKHFTLVIVPKDHLEIVKSKGQRTTYVAEAPATTFFEEESSEIF